MASRRSNIFPQLQIHVKKHHLDRMHRIYRIKTGACAFSSHCLLPVFRISSCPSCPSCLNVFKDRLDCISSIVVNLDALALTWGRAITKFSKRSESLIESGGRRLSAGGAVAKTSQKEQSHRGSCPVSWRYRPTMSPKAYIVAGATM